MSKDRAVRCVDLARSRVIVEPGHPVEQPDQKELRRQCGHREIKPLDPQAWQAENRDHRRGYSTRDHHMDHDAHLGKGCHELVTRIGAHSHKSTRPQGHLATVTHKNIQPNRGNRVDQKRHQDRIGPVIIYDKWDHQKGESQDRIVAIAIKFDRKGLTVRFIGFAEIARFTI